MCDASLAALERLLMTPRHKFGPSHEWLANWNFPPPKAWAEAQRLAAERSNQNCADSALTQALLKARRGHSLKRPFICTVPLPHSTPQSR